MSSAIREHLRSNVVAYICLFWLMTGTAIAAQNLPANSVTSNTIRNGQVKTPDLAPGAVARGKIRAAAVAGPQVADGSLTGADVLGASLGGGDIADNGLTGADILASSLGGGDIADDGLTGVDILASSLGGGDIADDGLTGADILASSLGGGDIEDDSLTGADILESSLTGVPGDGAGTGPAGGDLSGSYPNPVIAPDAVGGAEVVESALAKVPNADTLDGVDSTGFLTPSSSAGGDLSGTLGSLQIIDNAVGPAELSDLPAAKGGAYAAVVPTHQATTPQIQLLYLASGGAFPSGTGISVPETGNYLVTAAATWDTNAAGGRKIEIFQNVANNGSSLAIDEVDPLDSGFTSHSAIGIARLNAGDQVFARYTQTSGGDLDLWGSTVALAFLGP